MYQTIATQLKTLRKTNGLTQEDFAKHMGITKRSLGRYEKYAHRMTLYSLYRLNQTFDVDWNYWLNPNESLPPLRYEFPLELSYQTTDEASFYGLLGQRMAYLRKVRGMSQRQLSQQMGMSDRAIAYYESAKRRIHLEDLLCLTEQFGLSPVELLHAI